MTIKKGEGAYFYTQTGKANFARYVNHEAGVEQNIHKIEYSVDINKE